MGGSATGGGADYRSNPGPLVFRPGETTKALTVEIVDDASIEGGETVELTLQNPTGASLAAPDVGVLTIVDDEPSFQFKSSQYRGSEASSKASILVQRSGRTDSAATVEYALGIGSTATGGGVDYTLSAGTLSFAPGRATATFEVVLHQDGLDEPNETVALALSNPSAGYGIGTPGTATLHITDDDVAGAVQFGAPTYSFEEGGSAAITVTRSDGSAEGVEVHCASSDGTAVEGIDYTGSSGLLTFGAGETSKTVLVPLAHLAGHQGNRYLYVSLSAASYGVTVRRNAAVLWIVDDE